MYETAYPNVPVTKTSSTIAELVKYVTNCFLATKVSFANEMQQICGKLEVDYDKVVEYAKLDPRLGSSHWAVPGPVPTHEGKYVRGFGGHCFPKDLNALITVAKRLGVDPTVMSAAWKKNLEVRGPENSDWEHMKGRAVSKKENKQ
jgi:UDPglucose 6-dehydrogenase